MFPWPAVLHCTVTASNGEYATAGLFICTALIRRMANAMAKVTFILVRIHGQRFPSYARGLSYSQRFWFSQRSLKLANLQSSLLYTRH